MCFEVVFMGIMGKILNKSNSYRFYKSEYEKFSKKENKSKKQIKKLKKEIKNQKKEISKLKKEIKNYNDDISFLRRELIENKKN